MGNRSGRLGRSGGLGLALALLLAALVASGSPAGASEHHASVASIRPHVAADCPSGDLQMDFVNNSGFPDSDVYGAVTLTGGTVSPSNLENQSLPLAGNYPAASDVEGHYFCLGNGATGRLGISIGAPIPTGVDGLPKVQPTTNAPYRFAYIEFTYPGSGSIDGSNVNDFDFPVDLQAFTTPGASTPYASTTFTGNTCQIVNAMKSAVTALGGIADWNGIEYAPGGQFVRIISPDNSFTGTNPWPDMTPYLTALEANLPTVGPGGLFPGDKGPLTVEDYYVGSSSTDPQKGWVYYQGYIDPSTGDVTFVGDTAQASISPPPALSPAPDAQTITTTLSGLAASVYAQQIGSNYEVGGAPDSSNDVYARVWNDITSAFAYGYWGSGYGNDTADFFGTWTGGTGTVAPSGGQVPFPPQRTTSLAPAPGGIAYNLYAAELSQFSPEYTFPFNENYFGAGTTGGSPDLTPTVGGEIRMTLPADGWNGQSGSSTCASTNPMPATGTGYDEVASDGGLFNFGTDGFYGSMGGKPLNQPIVGMAVTRDRGGYWEVARDGGLFAFGDAPFYGSMGGQPLNAPIVGMAPTPDGGGYWEVARDGGLFAFGDARFYGSMGGQHLNQPIVGMAATPDGGGYWEVASDGGLFAFGDASFYGSMGGQHLNQPIVGMAATTDGAGYWEVASDGGLFSFGDAAFQGSMGGQPLNAPIVGMQATPDGGGYWEVASDGGLFSFGDATFHGSMGGQPLNAPIVGMG